MTSSTDPATLAVYTEALRAFLESRDESARERAYEFGRESLMQGGGLLDLVAVHSRALQEILAACPPEDAARVSARAAEFLAEGLSPHEMALRGFRETNDRLQTLNATLESSVDKRTRELQRSNAKLYALLDAAPVGLIATDADLFLEWCNLGAAWTFGLDSNTSVVGLPLVEGFSQLEPFVEEFGRVLEGQAIDRTDVVIERGEERRLYDIRLRPVFSDGKVIGTLSVFVDVTPHKEAEEARRSLERQVRVAQRMEAIGRLAGGIAHDFNNVLTVIMAYGMFVQERMSPEDPSFEEMDIIIGATERAAKLTAQLLAFSRRRVQQLDVVQLNETVAETERMLRRVLGEHIELAVDLQPDVAMIKADLSQIEQVLLNLCVNARDAMPGGGKLTIETRNVEFSHGLVQDRGDDLAPGAYVMLAVSDTGHGMDEETLSRIFEPFFTTKASGEGTGLGLATVYGTVKQHEGGIWVYSEPGRGTTFKIYLPQHVVDEVAPAPELAARSSEAWGSEAILIVEDEELVRQAAARILSDSGYRVWSAASGAEALEVVAAKDEPLDLLITDIVMPEMSGQLLVEQLQASTPGLRALFMSGFTDNAVVQHGMLERGTPFLQKPFSPDTLRRAVREVLDAAGPVED